LARTDVWIFATSTGPGHQVWLFLPSDPRVAIVTQRDETLAGARKQLENAAARRIGEPGNGLSTGAKLRNRVTRARENVSRDTRPSDFQTRLY